MIKAIIFDMDGVLCDSEPFIRQAAVDMFAKVHKTAVKPEDFLPFTGAGEDRFIGGVAEKYGVKLAMPEDKNTTYRIYLELIQGALQPLAGVRQFIGLCREKQLKLAVATSADLIKLKGNLQQLQLPAEQFDAVVYGENVERKKPDPQIFLLAAKKLEIDPKDCLVVEDAVNGIRAGKSAGCRCLGLTTSFTEAALREAGADWIAPDLAHVPAEITSLFA